MPYQLERAFALNFFAALDAAPHIQAEMTAAIEECFHRYDTGPFENRFIVGAVVEQILGATARALGMAVENAGAHRQAYDLELAPGQGASVKYTSHIGRSARVRLTNSQGAIGAWATGTVFVVAGLGVGYADAGLAPGITTPAGDGHSLDVSLERLRAFWDLPPSSTRGPSPAWLSSMPTPNAQPQYFRSVAVPARAAVRAPRLAGDPIALDILSSGRSQTLLHHFKWSI